MLSNSTRNFLPNFEEEQSGTLWVCAEALVAVRVHLRFNIVLCNARGNCGKPKRARSGGTAMRSFGLESSHTQSVAFRPLHLSSAACARVGTTLRLEVCLSVLEVSRFR